MFLNLWAQPPMSQQSQRTPRPLQMRMWRKALMRFWRQDTWRFATPLDKKASLLFLDMLLGSFFFNKSILCEFEIWWNTSWIKGYRHSKNRRNRWPLPQITGSALKGRDDLAVLRDFYPKGPRPVRRFCMQPFKGKSTCFPRKQIELGY